MKAPALDADRAQAQVILEACDHQMKHTEIWQYQRCQMASTYSTSRFAVIPVRGVVVFPQVSFTCQIGRPPSVLALKEAISRDGIILLATQHDETVEVPVPEQIYKIGTSARITHHLRSPSDIIKVEFKAVERARIEHIEKVDGFWQARCSRIIDSVSSDTRIKRLVDELTSFISEHVEKTESCLRSDARLEEALYSDDPWLIMNAIAANLNIGVGDKQKILEIRSLRDRIKRIIEIIQAKLDSKE